jgi:hypothetical protein
MTRLAGDDNRVGTQKHANERYVAMFFTETYGDDVSVRAPRRNWQRLQRIVQAVYH